MTDFALNPKDLYIIPLPTPGQNAGTQRTGIRITHLPSGITVTESYFTTESANRHLAMETLRMKVLSWTQTEQNRKAYEAVQSQQTSPCDDPAELAYWNFDARKKGYGRWNQCPQSERDAFKAEYNARYAHHNDPSGELGLANSANKATFATLATPPDDQYQEVLRPLLSRYGMQSYLNGGPLRLKAHTFRMIIDRARALFTGQPASTAVPCKDPVVEANRQLLLERSELGIKKYGVTLDGSDLSEDEYLQHALEEGLDLCNYLQGLLRLRKQRKSEAK